MPALETTIKNAIKAKLDGLTPATLGEVQADDFKLANILDREIAKYPAAILTSPTVEAESLTNRDNLRTFSFDIAVVSKGENITTATQIENLRDALMKAFDDDPTLGGAADGGVEPAISPVEVITSRSKDFVVFVLTLRAKAAYQRV